LMRIRLIINADQTVIETIRAPIARLREEGHVVEPRLTFEGGDACRMAEQGANTGCELIVAAGGDGTINEVVNGIHKYLEGKPKDGSIPRLGILPLGTANDLASALKIPAAVDEALDLAVMGEVMDADIGIVNDRCFVNVSTGGFGAEATDEAPDEIKRTLGPLAYFLMGAKKFATLHLSEAKFIGESPIYDGPFLLYAVGNSWRTGGGNKLTPRAELTDGKLDLCVVTEMSRMDFMRLLPNLRTGSHVDHPGVIYRQVEHLVVDAKTELSVNADGEPLRARRLEYVVSPHRIPIVVPPEAESGPVA